MSPPPTLTPDQDISEAANMIFKTGLRALPVVEGKKVVGVVSLHDVVDIASKSKVFKQTAAESIMSVPEVVTEETDIGAARVLMREKNISRLPVVGKDGKLRGVVTIFDMLRAIKPTERMGFYSMLAEKENLTEISISTVMNTQVTTAKRDAPLNDVVGLMRKDDTDGLIVAENGTPVGVITEKDLLEVYVSGLTRRASTTR